jgi:ATP adenylyltransferase
MEKSCVAYDPLNGNAGLPGGYVYRNEHWSLEAGIGPFPVGTLILKPIRHVLNFSNLSIDESREFVTLLKIATEMVVRLTKCDQTYICQWSHMG